MRSQSLALRLGALLLATASRAAAAELIQGVSYSPVPLKSIVGASNLPQDDWMSEQANVLWGRAGRRDLEVIKSLGANAVRLYGNNPMNSHTAFLDEAWRLGLSVLPGMSDYPYYQQVPGGCKHMTNFDCFVQIRPLFTMNLLKGWLRPDRTYHPALKIMNIINEPDLKMPHTATTGGFDDVVKMCRSIISAFDAMLDAEKSMKVTGPLINFTATFSYGICFACERFRGSPALGQMAQLDDAMRNPQRYGYRPLNNITEAYLTRWTHSFNTQNPATDLQGQFLNDYELTFPQTPVYIGEYHRVGANQVEDLGTILDIANRSELFKGISFFEYQVAYWKTGSEMDFGMFGLAEEALEKMDYFGMFYQVYCLNPVEDRVSGLLMPNAVARVYGGPGINASDLCLTSPWLVPVSPDGLDKLGHEESPALTGRFAQRILEHLGASVLSTQGLADFARRYTPATKADWPRMMAELGGPQWWTEFDPEAKCLANRNADVMKVGSAIGWACSQARNFSCAGIPALCGTSTYTTGDYVFSMLYKELGPSADPLVSCNFGGAAVFAGSKLSSQWTGAHECMVGGNAGELTMSTATVTTTLPPAPTTVPLARTTIQETTTAAPVATSAAPAATSAAPAATSAAPAATSAAPTATTAAPQMTTSTGHAAAPHHDEQPGEQAAPTAAPAASSTAAPHRDERPGEQATTTAAPAASTAAPHRDERPGEQEGHEEYASSGRRLALPWQLPLAVPALLGLAIRGR